MKFLNSYFTNTMFLTPIFLGVNCSEALASETAHTCVQRQSEALGIDKSIVNLFHRYGIDEKNFPANLDEHDEFIMCKQLGLIREDLQSYWPSKAQPVRVFAGNEIDLEIKNVFERYGKTALIELERDYGVRLAYPVDIIIGFNKEEIWENWKNSLPNPDIDLESYFNSEFNVVCSQDDEDFGFGGFSIYNRFVACPLSKEAIYDADLLLTGDDAESAYLAEKVVFHEFFHVVQSELS